MVISCDTSFLFSLYGNDVHTGSATAQASKVSGPVTLTEIHEFEFINSLRLAQFRGLLAAGDVRARRVSYENAVLTGRLVISPLELAPLLVTAKNLSSRHTAQDGHRSFDILLVAAALRLGATTFLTFDARQQALAAAEGLAISI